MKRESSYQFVAKGKPGETVYYLRKAKGWSQRALAERCSPALNHTTIRRLEKNEGYQQDTLQRVAKALNVKPEELFYPPEVADIMTLDKKSQDEIMSILRSVLSLHKNKKMTKP